MAAEEGRRKNLYQSQAKYLELVSVPPGDGLIWLQIEEQSLGKK